MRSFKCYYGVDPAGQGFYWPGSPTKRPEWQEVKRLRPMEAQSVYMCRPGSRQGDIFLEDDFDWYDPPPGLEFGRQMPAVRNFLSMGSMIITGWDTAMSANSDADFTVGVTGLLVPCEHYHRGENPELVGPCDPHFDIYILDVVREKLDLGDAVNAVRNAFLKWSPHMVVIEKRANGTPIMQALATSGIPMEGVDPLENKRDRVIHARGVGSVQGWFRLHRMKFPIYAEWLEPLIREIKDFSGERGNRDDQVDAMVHMVGAAITEGGQNVRLPSAYQDDVQLRDILRPDAPTDPLSLLMRAQNTEVQTLREIGMAEDPFHDRCGRCHHFDQKLVLCGFHGTRVSALHPACEAFDSDDGLTFVNWR